MLVYMKLHTKKSMCVCVSEWSITHVHRKHVKRVVTKKFDHIYNSDALIFLKKYIRIKKKKDFQTEERLYICMYEKYFKPLCYLLKTQLSTTFK